mmetsp:Transcript_19404/g.40503  ORF Transcript_19404/g.40503 Transcript_19404/m.40503 type:complete len:242 (-) Transcript_19404:1039-1764(-)
MPTYSLASFSLTSTIPTLEREYAGMPGSSMLKPLSASSLAEGSYNASSFLEFCCSTLTLFFLGTFWADDFLAVLFAGFVLGGGAGRGEAEEEDVASLSRLTRTALRPLLSSPLLLHSSLSSATFSFPKSGGGVSGLGVSSMSMESISSCSSSSSSSSSLSSSSSRRSSTSSLLLLFSSSPLLFLSHKFQFCTKTSRAVAFPSPKVPYSFTFPLTPLNSLTFPSSIRVAIPRLSLAMTSITT